MPLSPKVVELFDQAKKYFISIGGSESVFLNFVAKLNANNFTSSRLNDAFDSGYLTKILILNYGDRCVIPVIIPPLIF